VTAPMIVVSQNGARETGAAHEREIPMTRYRIELQNDDGVEVIGYTSEVDARQRELSTYALRLSLKGVTGTLALVEPQTGEVVARRYLDADTDKLPPRRQPVS
jgi:hypothetical protein